jgi:dsRNA-specific ribonuclease
MRRTSVFLYYKTQAAGEANRRTVCEGELTLLRSRVVGNKNLFKVAQQLELGNFSQFLRSGSGPTYSREKRKKISVSDPDPH